MKKNKIEIGSLVQVNKGERVAPIIEASDRRGVVVGIMIYEDRTELSIVPIIANPDGGIRYQYTPAQVSIVNELTPPPVPTEEEHEEARKPYVEIELLKKRIDSLERGLEIEVVAKEDFREIAKEKMEKIERLESRLEKAESARDYFADMLNLVKDALELDVLQSVGNDALKAIEVLKEQRDHALDTLTGSLDKSRRLEEKIREQNKSLDLIRESLGLDVTESTVKDILIKIENMDVDLWYSSAKELINS